MDKNEIIKGITNLNLNNIKYVILGSSSLVLRNIKNSANDIDIGIRLKDYNKYIKNSKNLKNIDFVIKNDDDIKIEIFDGFPLQDLNQIYYNKKKRCLVKDIEDIALIDKYIVRTKIMGEYTDLYDENKNLTGEKIFRKKGEKSITLEGRYTIVVLAIIENKNGELLVQKTFLRKKSVWALPGGHVKSGQNSFEAIKEELMEEMNINVDVSELKLLKTYKYNNAFKDVFYLKKDFNLDNIVIQEDEVEKVCYLSKKQILELIHKNEFRQTNIDSLEDYFNM